MYHHSVSIKIPPTWSFDPIDGDRMCPVLKDWLDECCVGRWTFHFSFCYNRSCQTAVFAFACEDDALAFKLRWV